MLVKWKKENIKVIPINGAKARGMGFKKLSGKSQIVLQPGWNDVHDGDWAYALTMVQPSLQDGWIEAKGGEEKEVEINYGKAKKKIKKITPKQFKELEPEEARGLVAETNGIKTLEGWLDTDPREDVRLAIQKRLDEVKSHGENK